MSRNVVSGFRRGVIEVLALLGCYAAYVGICFTDVSGQLHLQRSSNPRLLHTLRWDR
jgi:hypothetical protein